MFISKMSLLRNRRILNIVSQVLTKKVNPIITCRCVSHGALRLPLPPTSLLVNGTLNLQIVRLKSKSKKSQRNEASDSEEDESSDDDRGSNAILDKNTKIVTVNVNSTRTDAIVKSGLTIPRNKVEELFYEGKIRVNGEKITKKSAELREGDEVDVIKELNPETNFLTVARVEVLRISAKTDAISVKLRRCKSLLIENYETPWKAS